METLPPGLHFEKSGIKPVDRTTCSWVQFPNGYQYLLANYIKIQYSPLFNDKGEIEDIDYGTVNENVAKQVEEFLNVLSVPQSENGEFFFEEGTLKPIILALFRLLKTLLEPQYDWTPEKYKQVLCYDPTKYTELLGIILKHLFSGK